MIELYNISFTEYFELEDKSEYDYAIKYAFSFNKPVDHFEFGDFMQLSFGIVKDIQFDISTGLTWEQLFDYCKQIKCDISKEKLLIVCQVRSYVVAEIERIIEIESITLAHDNTEEEEQAGMDLFKHLGIYLQLRSLTLGDVTKNETIRNIKYEECFTELVAQRKLSDYQKAFNKIITEKNKYRT